MSYVSVTIRINDDAHQAPTRRYTTSGGSIAKKGVSREIALQLFKDMVKIFKEDNKLSDKLWEGK